MNLGIKDKTALVTASSRGLGKAIALQLSREGANVAICARKEDKLFQAKKDIAERTGGQVVAQEENHAGLNLLPQTSASLDVDTFREHLLLQIINQPFDTSAGLRRPNRPPTGQTPVARHRAWPTRRTRALR